jgi:hypothetical protein
MGCCYAALKTRWRFLTTMSALTEREKRKIEELLIKLKQKEEFQEQEAEYLKQYLENEKERAIKVGDFALAMAVGFLLIGLFDYLLKKKKKR